MAAYADDPQLKAVTMAANGVHGDTELPCGCLGSQELSQDEAVSSLCNAMTIAAITEVFCVICMIQLLAIAARRLYTLYYR